MNLKEIPLTSLKLSDNIKNLLIEKGIQTAYDFVSTSINFYSKTKGIGEKSLSEICSVIKVLLDSVDYSSVIIGEKDEKTQIVNSKNEQKDRKIDDLLFKLLGKNRDYLGTYNNFLNYSVEMIQSSARTKFGILNNSIFTIGELLSCPIETFRSTRNLGKKSLQEIEDIQNLIKDIQKLLNCEDKVNCTEKLNILDSGLQDNLSQLKTKLFGTNNIIFLSETALLQTSIQNLELSVRARNGMMQNSIHTIGDLIDCPYSQLKCTKNLGKTTLKEINNLIINLEIMFDIIRNREKKNQIVKKDEVIKKINTNNIVNDDFFKDYNLPTRIKNAFIELNIYSIAQFKANTLATYKNIKAIGKDSFKFIFELYAKINKITPEKITVEKFFFADTEYLIINDKTIMYDFFIKNCNINYNVLRFLLSNNINSLRDLLNTSYLFLINNLGSTSYSYLVELLNEKIYVLNFKLEKINTLEKNILKLLKNDINKCIKNYYVKSVYIKAINDISCQASNLYKENDAINLLRNESFLEMLYSNELTLKYAESIFIAKLPFLKWISKQELKSSLPKHLQSNKIFQILKEDLEKNNKIVLKNGCITQKLPKYKDYIDNIENEKWKFICLKRLKNYTLDDIGAMTSLTRERVRQIFAKANINKPIVLEDIYKDFYEKYDICENAFIYIFEESKETFTYLKLMYTKGKKNLENIYLDSDISDKVKIRYERFRDSSKIILDGEKIERNTISILEFCVKKYCKNIIRFDTFYNLYRDYIISNIVQGENYLLSKHGLEGRMPLLNFVIWNQWHSFRYYDKTQINQRKFILQLGFEEYKNISISTKLIFDKNKELMDSMDIRNEYELHNILRTFEKSIPKKYNLSFGRSPGISFGKGDKQKQWIELATRYKSYSIADLGRIYEKKYGFLGKSAIANFSNILSEDRKNKSFSKNSIDKNQNILLKFKTFLNRDIYDLDQLNELFSLNFPGEDCLTENDLRRLGFNFTASMTYGILAYDCRYNTLSEFMSTYLEQDIIDLNGEMDFLYKNSASYNYISAKQLDFDIIEFLPKRYISIKRLGMLNINKNHLIDYCESIEKLMGGKYFSINSIKNKGFNHIINKLGFDDFFYESLLRAYDRCRFISYENCKIFRFTNNQFNIIDFITQTVEQFQKIEIFEFKDFLEKEYGINTTVENLVNIIRQSEMYYSNTMKTVYIDIDKFYEEF